MDPAIQNIIEDKEQVLWEGKQDFKSTITKAISGLALFVIIAFFAMSFSGNCEINGEPASPEQCSSATNIFGYIFIAVGVLVLVGSYLRYKVTHYAITNKRVIIKSGLIGADMRSVYYDQVRSAFVNVGLIGKMFRTGSILFDTGRMTQTKNGSRTDYDKFVNIQRPYEVYKYVQQNVSGRKESLYSGRADRESRGQ